MIDAMFTSRDIVGIVTGFVFVFAVLAIATILSRRTRLDSFVIRKLVHIAVAHWWLIALHFHDSVPPALVGPVVFVILNYIDYRRTLYPGFTESRPAGGIGTVIFPISLIVIVAVTFGGVFPLAAGTAGILVMGYGDGVAALVGRRFGRRQLGRRIGKTVVGSAAMFVVSSLVLLAILAVQIGLREWGVSALSIFVIAAAATLIEMLTPYDLDNLTVPIAVTVFVGFLPV